MATSPIGSAGAMAANEFMQSVGQDQARREGARKAPSAVPGSQISNGATPPSSGPQSSGSQSDISNFLLAEVAMSDLNKLTTLLDPALDNSNANVLDSLLRSAIQEVQNGNPERAIGYLADYATRDPCRGESLSSIPALEPVRDKIESMVGRMTLVARMSAENGLSEAERRNGENQAKLPAWETSADVLLKLAQRLFEAGGYANYSRSAELARAVAEAVRDERKPNAHALAASASASSTQFPLSSHLRPDSLASLNAGYWPKGEPSRRRDRAKTGKPTTRLPGGFAQNIRDLRIIMIAALRQLWQRAPLLVMLLLWFAIGLPGAVAYAVCNYLAPHSFLIACGNLIFGMWSLGFLVLVGFGFYARIRYRTPKRT